MGTADDIFAIGEVGEVGALELLGFGSALRVLLLDRVQLPVDFAHGEEEMGEDGPPCQAAHAVLEVVLEISRARLESLEIEIRLF